MKNLIVENYFEGCISKYNRIIIIIYTLLINMLHMSMTLTTSVFVDFVKQ